MKILLKSICAFVLAVLAAGCGSDDEFVVRGTVEGNPTLNLRAVYYGRGAMQTVVTAVREGKFEFSGRSMQPTLVEVFDNDYRWMGRFYTMNGERITCHLDRSNPYLEQAQGNKTMEEWADFMHRNAEVLQKGGSPANDLVAEYVSSHPESVVSTLLMLTSFDASDAPLRADSLMSLIAPVARPNQLVEGYNYVLQRLVTSAAIGPLESVSFRDMQGDTMARFNPRDRAYTVVAVTERTSGRDTLLETMRRLASDKRVQLLDLSVDIDTLSWRRSTRLDSATWTQGWTAGYIASPALKSLGVSRVPFYVVCDSTGERLYSGPSINEAEKVIPEP